MGARVGSGNRHRVVVVGAGFGGLAVAKGLRKAPVDVTLIDRRNYHLFQPLLYQVATAGLSPADIAQPIRAVTAGWTNVRVVMGRVSGVDVDAREVLLEDGPRQPYDTLVVATGARHAYFGNDGWEPFAPGLKKIEDATEIRRRILIAFEKAETEPDPDRQKKLLTFVVVGAGPTGVEMAGAISELASRALARDFRTIDLRLARVILVEAGKRVLPPFPEGLSEKARQSLISLGVEVRLGQPVTKCDVDGVNVGEERIEAASIIWAAGVMASPAARWLGAEKDRAGRVIVGPDLRVAGLEDVFVIGDTAAAKDQSGKPLPGIAPVAKQQGEYVAARILAITAGVEWEESFQYRHNGNLATIGRKSAVVDFGRWKVSGFPAWVLWSVAHVYFLIGFRNRLVVSLNWFWNYLTFQRGARLITGPQP